MSPNSSLLRCRVAESREELDNSVTFHYLAEGAANVAYVIRRYGKTAPNGKSFVFKGTNSAPSADSLVNHVLRVSKGLEKTLPPQDIAYHYDREIKPLFNKYQKGPHSFTDNLLDMNLVALDAAVFQTLNAEIAKHSTRQTGKITPGTHGLLMENMSSEPGRSVTIEFKPKWLAQSPNPPRDATRCRTCAMEASKVARGKDPQCPYICPLRIFGGDVSVINPYIERKVREAFAKLEDSPSPSTQQIFHIMSSISDWLVNGQGHVLLAALREIQLRHDEHGVTAPRSSSSETPDLLPIAMTLRDCSLYIRAVYNRSGSASSQRPLIEAKLGDLDFKSPAKRKDWEAKEQRLRKEGWYTDRAGAVPWSFGNCGFVGESKSKSTESAGMAHGLKATDARINGVHMRGDTRRPGDLNKSAPASTSRPLKS